MYVVLKVQNLNGSQFGYRFFVSEIIFIPFLFSFLYSFSLYSGKII